MSLENVLDSWDFFSGQEISGIKVLKKTYSRKGKPKKAVK